MVVEATDAGLTSLSNCSLTPGVDLAVAAHELVVDVADLYLLHPWVFEGLLDGDALGRIQVHHSVGQLHCRRLEVAEDGMSGEAAFAAELAIGVLCEPFVEVLDVTVKVGVVGGLRGVPQRATKDDYEVDHGTRPHIKLASIVRTWNVKIRLQLFENCRIGYIPVLFCTSGEM